jgi:hypothetical protein
MGREWSHSEAVFLKICSLFLSAAIMRWKSGEPAFAVEVYFSNGYSVIATLPKSLQCWVLSRTRNQLLHGPLRLDKPGVRQDEELEPRLNNGQFVVESPLARFGPLRFCLWVFFKPRVYINHLRTLQDLKANIRAEIGIANIPAAMSYG